MPVPPRTRTAPTARSPRHLRLLAAGLAATLALGTLAGAPAGAADRDASAAAPTGVQRAGEPYGPHDSPEDLVRQAYRDLLQRDATANEVAVAAAAIRSGQTAEEFLAALVALPETTTDIKQVVRLYRAYYLRNPDLGGYRHWIRQRRAGWTLPRISNEFAAAPEFSLRYGFVDDGEFVDLVYANVLDRKPDAKGRAYWMSRMAEGLYRGQLMTSFSESPEYVQKNQGAADVIVLYYGMFQQSMPLGLFDYYAPKVQSGELTVAELARQYLDDAKYHNRFR